MTTRRIMRRHTALTGCLAFAFATFASVSFAIEPLNDEQLDAITAGEEDSQLDEIVVNASRVTANGKKITLDGTLGVHQARDAINTADLLLRDSAQSNLKALVNLNAVNSVVNVLVNLNINIDSQVGELRQVNLTSGAGR